MAIIDVENKKRGITYVYESHSYWDRELKQPRSRRKLLGRRDPATGEVVPTGKRGRPRKSECVSKDGAHSRTEVVGAASPDADTLKEKDAVILALRHEVADLRSRLRSHEEAMRRALSALKSLFAEEDGNA